MMTSIRSTLILIVLGVALLALSIEAKRPPWDYPEDDDNPLSSKSEGMLDSSEEDENPLRSKPGGWKNFQRRYCAVHGDNPRPRRKNLSLSRRQNHRLRELFPCPGDPWNCCELPPQDFD